MKTIFVYLLLIFVVPAAPQTINQFDDNNERHGIWKKYFDNTNVLRYEGEFNHGKEVGLFKFYQNIGNKAVLVATRDFIKDSNLANVKFFTSTGKLISEGQMNGKLYIGEWKFYQKNSKELLILEYYNEEGNLNGDRFVYYKNGEIAEKQHFENGLLNGESLWYTEDKILIKQMIYNNDKLHGLSKFYSSEGQLIIEGTYKDDKKVGVWKYFENGVLVEEQNY